MSRQVLVHATARSVWVALAGVVFCDFVGMLLLSLGGPGWILGLTMMLLGAPYSAWLALETHPKRRTLTSRIAVANALFFVIAAISLFAFALYVLSGVQFG